MAWRVLPSFFHPENSCLHRSPRGFHLRVIFSRVAADAGGMVTNASTGTLGESERQWREVWRAAEQ